MANFKSEFHDYIEQKLKSKFTDYNIHIADDISYYFDGAIEYTSKDIIVVLSSGNISKTKTSLSTFGTGSVTISIYCDTDIKSAIAKDLDDLMESISELDELETLGTLCAKFDFNSPAVDSVPRSFNGIQVSYMSVSGTCLYGDATTLKIYQPTVLIDNVIVKNVFNFKCESSSNTMEFNAMGSRFIKRYEDTDSVTYSFTVIVNADNAQHNLLWKIANKVYDSVNGAFYSNKRSVLIKTDDSYNTQSFTAFLRLSSVYNAGNFLAIDVVIER